MDNFRNDRSRPDCKQTQIYYELTTIKDKIIFFSALSTLSSRITHNISRKLLFDQDGNLAVNFVSITTYNLDINVCIYNISVRFLGNQDLHLIHELKAYEQI